MWQLDVGDAPDVDVLRAGAAAVFLTQPDLARRLAERALPHDPTPLSALLLADAHAELGQVDAARHAQALAQERIRSDDDRLHVRLNQVSLTAFSDRRPDLALDVLAAARAELPDRYTPEIDSMAAQVTVFSARPAEALALAERVLAGSPPAASALRAASARVMALAMVDRSVEAIKAADRLLADVAAGPATPYAQGIAHIAAQVARFVYWVGQDAPATDPSGRWPVPPADGGRARPMDPVFHPLFEGGRRLLEGQVAAAIAPLREAVAQQRSGEGLLRSEAVALLVVALAATGNVADARQLLDESPPDRVAVYPGLRPWAESAVDAADGRPSAVALAFDGLRGSPGCRQPDQRRRLPRRGRPLRGRRPGRRRAVRAGGIASSRRSARRARSASRRGRRATPTPSSTPPSSTPRSAWRATPSSSPTWRSPRSGPSAPPPGPRRQRSPTICVAASARPTRHRHRSSR